MNDDNLIERFKPADRANHWLTAITLILVALTGFFHYMTVGPNEVKEDANESRHGR